MRATLGATTRKPSTAQPGPTIDSPGCSARDHSFAPTSPEAIARADTTRDVPTETTARSRITAGTTVASAIPSTPRTVKLPGRTPGILAQRASRAERVLWGEFGALDNALRRHDQV